MTTATKNILVLGAGFSGLAAGLTLAEAKTPTHIVEKSTHAGGLSRTLEVDGVKFELGPHIYFDKDQDVLRFWESLLPAGQLRTYTRNNRIFYQGKYIHSPLNLWNAFVKLGPLKVGAFLSSFAGAKLSRRPINSAEDWVKANFGAALFEHFFKVYNEKIWGLDCSEISPNWAGQRIKSSLSTMVVKSLTKDKDFIIKTFSFPDGGSERLVAAQMERLSASPDVQVRTETTITRLMPVADGFLADFSTGERNVHFTDVISTIHLNALGEILVLPEAQSEQLQQAVASLQYRHLVLVNLVFEKEAVKTFREHWIDIHDPAVKALRVTNFGNYDFGLAKANKVGVGLEYNCFDTDEIWHQTTQDILQQALADLQYMGLTQSQPLGFEIVKIPQAYPIYFRGYEEYTSTVFDILGQIPRLHLAGRNSMYKWNNMHHSVKTGILAAQNALGATHDLFAVKGMVAIGKDSD
ncbi:FAD-dependent oxidoreductase [Eisenibacter elegans]|jgi:protoporphyrinogen oxidase|uniref:FAD-dependent oxidoreductase n=1 Tax=Eisenibacter elegans TaxID=997 RepID=UPI0003F62131|nr:FAD-dependent oxidoreductase [Eisenibacter elegans]